jgi:prepilin-type N-terminal cleavage/methylation domain-containing protein
MRRGFTIVEIIVVLTAMAILLTLGTVGLQGVLANGRDSERAADINTIARGLEERYLRGNAYINAGPAKGSYPSINEMRHMDGNTVSGYTPTQVSGGYLTKGLPGTSLSSFTNPGGTKAWTLICTSSCAAAGNSTQIPTAFGGGDKYVYEPVSADGSVCLSSNCTSFNLYWKKEVDSSLVTVKSKHR